MRRLPASALLVGCLLASGCGRKEPEAAPGPSAAPAALSAPAPTNRPVRINFLLLGRTKFEDGGELGIPEPVMAAEDNAGWFVVRVDEVIPGNAEADLNTLGGMQSQITRSLPEEMAAQFVRSLQKVVGVERNAKTIAAVKKRFNSAADTETP